MAGRQVSFSDAGTYTCLATNRLGQDRAEAMLVVKGTAPSPTPTKPTKITQGHLTVFAGDTERTKITQGHLTVFAGVTEQIKIAQGHLTVFGVFQSRLRSPRARRTTRWWPETPSRSAARAPRTPRSS